MGTIQIQSKRHSFYEALANTFAGMGLSWCASWFVYPALGMGGNAGTYAAATAFFTVLSIARGYVVRRVGNHLQGIKLKEGSHDMPKVRR